MVSKMVIKIRLIVKRFMTIKNLIVWSYGTPPAKDLAVRRIHILIVKKIEYVKIAKICIYSFLYYHPNSIFILHCDTSTFRITSKLFLKKSKFVQVVCDIDDKVSWQESKCNLLISLSNSNDIYMDADLRWNGTIPNLKGVTFFVEEFSMTEKSPYRQLIRELTSLEFNLGSMKNTSFFYLGGYEISEECRLKILETIKNFKDYLVNADLGILDYPIVLRLSEQIVISLISESWNKKISFLKQEDAHRDGKFVESSYYGATGSAF